MATELRLAMGSCTKLHPRKGHDACLRDAVGCVDAIGVADGVSMSALDGHPEIVARELMQGSFRAIREAWDTDHRVITPTEALQSAFDTLVQDQVRGSSTATLAIFADGTLRTVNVGDSGFMVIFDHGEASVRSKRQQTVAYEDGCGWRKRHLLPRVRIAVPHQLNPVAFLEHRRQRLHPRDTPRVDPSLRIYDGCGNRLRDDEVGEIGINEPSDGDTMELKLNEYDVVVAGTDGLWDYVTDNAVENVCRAHHDDDPERLAERLAGMSLDAQMGIREGPIDDITVVVARVTRVDVASGG
ncbi:unnamed protein product (mitochondrion) [Plasmodiophora brassicae]|uniref:Protein phosphatase n=1 Tax=Plasmodiophora brassicae TaxID=37360 RepID=A0A0G4IVN3_PLABS|nr:hypothetical protein PBRA_001085 [Plasmodiophora brassicae]SPQ97196.1 unnamed protein product [Plasmodiophora brassicae]